MQAVPMRAMSIICFRRCYKPATAGFHEWQFCELLCHRQCYHMPVVFDTYTFLVHARLLTAFVCSMHRSLLQTTKTYKH